MWVQAGFPPDSFWQETPRNFQLVMRGVRQRLEMEAQARTSLAYEAGAFAGLAHHGKLKSLTHYTRKSQAQTPTEMVAMLQAMGTHSNMKIRRIEKGA